MLSSTELQRSIFSQLRSDYDSVRAFTLRLTETLSPEDQMVQSMTDASPTKWHLAHTTWFFETFVLSGFSGGYRSVNPEFRRVFNSYYKQVGAHPMRSSRGGFSRPSLSEVLEYRVHVDEAMRELLASDPSDEVASLVTLGLNHEQQHQELIVTDILHAYWSQPLRPAYRHETVESTKRSAPMNWVEFDGGIVEIGHSGASFAFDNESPRHEVMLMPFRLASRLVTNGEFLEFIADGGYRRPELWLSDGWDTVCQQNWSHPIYWERDGDSWRQFTSHGMRPLGLDEPVCHVSYFEADAYARWAGARLPLESEWEHAASRVKVAGNFAESLRLHPAVAQESGLAQMFGDLWEWTGSAYLSYPGFKAAAGAVGEYNGKFMCNQFVLRGGSCATPESHIRASYRNFFPPSARWQFSGIRLAADVR